MTANFVKGLAKLVFCDEDQVPVGRVTTSYGDILFTMYGEYTEFRVRTLFTKEPETIAWMDTFKPGEVFWDIGANIGGYSLYAAKKGVIVQAFEPAPVNYWLLTRNIMINEFKNITAYPFALSDMDGFFFWEPHINPAAGDNQLLSLGSTACAQAYSIDQLASHPKIQFPNHIKLDVDGIERQILMGGEKTLGDERVRSVLCEIDEREPRTSLIVEFLAEQGFGAPVTRHPPYFDEAYYAPMFNYVFTKIVFERASKRREGT